MRVITLEITKGELMCGRDICQNPEGYKWNKTYYQNSKFKNQNSKFNFKINISKWVRVKISNSQILE